MPGRCRGGGERLGSGDWRRHCGAHTTHVAVGPAPLSR
ncbi:Hypothetical protein AA314_06961 [Archangium gephyra]|uniref:Uncharacterized protein n=1 Tax=Archangium gephyra TaxID=48 RepID=A0AAC8QCS7_9BACT|nr:Hypothetical protein AA314_06961 [Archangium gephyra]